MKKTRVLLEVSIVLSILGIALVPVTGAALDCVMQATPTQASDGSTIALVLVVLNNNGSQANDVKPSPITFVPTKTASAVCESGPSPSSVNIPEGESKSFTWIYKVKSGTDGGTITFNGLASGKDAKTGKPIASNISSATVVVKRPQASSPTAPSTSDSNKEMPDYNREMRLPSIERILVGEAITIPLEKELKDAEKEGRDTRSARRFYENGNEYLRMALNLHCLGNYIAANTCAVLALRNFSECKEILLEGWSAEKIDSEIEKMLNKAKDDISEIEKLIEQRRSEGKDTTAAESLLQTGKDMIEYIPNYRGDPYLAYLIAEVVAHFLNEAMQEIPP